MSKKLISILVIMVFAAECLCYNSLASASNGTQNVLSQFIDQLENVAINESAKYAAKDKEMQDLMNAELPTDCSQREKSKSQPRHSESSRLKKCCPHGEGLTAFRENTTDELCDSTSFTFKPNIISAILYDNCIEDEETDVNLPIEIGNPCNASLIYSDDEDTFFVLQDGSLLIMDKYGNDSYTVEKHYCLDMDNVSGTTYAIICITEIEEHLARGQIVAIAILMLISIPCVLIVGYLHLALKELRTLHGLSLSLMSLCLATGYFLHSLVHIFNVDSSKIGYAIQFFILSYFMWFLCLCCNVLLNIWLRIPMNMRPSRLLIWCNFGVYCGVSFGLSILFVLLTIHKGLPGMPSYFIQGLTASIRESQRYFIPPVSTVLFLSFVIMIASFFGFQRIKKRGADTKRQNGNLYVNVNAEIDELKYQEVKKDAKCISFLGLILIVSWLLEVVTFYSPGPETYLMIMEMVNGLQGVFILLIFVVVRRRRTIILRWWYDRGSHTVEDVEMTEINK